MFESNLKMFCWTCGAQVSDFVKVASTDSCEACLADLHCSRNCRFYDRSAHNECREGITNYVKDKEKSNFCTSFDFKRGEQGEKADLSSARSKLDALFKK